MVTAIRVLSIATPEHLDEWLEANRGPPTTRREAFFLVARTKPPMVDAVADVVRRAGLLEYDLAEILENTRGGLFASLEPDER